MRYYIDYCIDRDGPVRPCSSLKKILFTYCSTFNTNKGRLIIERLGVAARGFFVHCQKRMRNERYSIF
jgi:hypothetical protein